MRGSIQQGPNYVHPERPSAVGSRNSSNRNDRDEYVESKLIIDEEVDKILNHISAKLPPEVLEQLHVGGSVKEILHNYFNQGFQNMQSRYLTTVEDEMAKKFRSLIDKEEHNNLNRYTPREISELINSLGGIEQFNTSEIEKGIVNIYGHLHGHALRGVFDLEQVTNTILRQKSDVGGFLRGENSYSVVKCSFSDNIEKPETVDDINFVLNVLDNELISKVMHHQEFSDRVIANIVSDHILELVDREIAKLGEKRIQTGEEELNSSDALFRKINSLEEYIDKDEISEESKQYQFVAQKFYDAIEGISSEIEPEGFDGLNFRENVQRILDNDNLRTRGFNSAVNSMTAILDSSRMGYQHIENNKNARQLVIKEYEDHNPVSLPDERYMVRLSYFDLLQLREMRVAYCQQLDEFDSEVEKLEQVVEKLYQKNKSGKDYNDVLKEKLFKAPEEKKGWFGKDEEEEDEFDQAEEKLWDEVIFVQPEATIVEELNATFISKIKKIKTKFNLLSEKIYSVYKTDNPSERLIAEERLDFLEKSFIEFCSGYNPYHIQPGLLLEIKITTIKRKKTTMTGMSNVLNEFLANISRGFSDSAFSQYRARRSTIRSDIDQEFSMAAREPKIEDVLGVAEIE